MKRDRRRLEPIDWMGTKNMVGNADLFRLVYNKTSMAVVL